MIVRPSRIFFYVHKITENHNLDSLFQGVFFGEGFDEVTYGPKSHNTYGPNGQHFGLWALGLCFCCFSSFSSKMLPHRGALGPGVFGPRAQTSVWKHFAAEAAEAAKT